MAHKQLVTGMELPRNAESSICEGCVEGKMKRKQLKAVGEIRSHRKLQLIHSDVSGPMPTESIGGHSLMTTQGAVLLKHKSEVFEKFKEYEARVTNDSGQPIGTLRSDNGGEYWTKEFRSYLKVKGIWHELTIPYSPEQNGVAARMNRTVMESARSMIAHACLQNSYWAEAVTSAAYVRNRVPTQQSKVARHRMKYGMDNNHM
jgi:hypothetical protein